MSREIDVHTDDTFQKRDWRAERIMWVLMLVFILAGLTGFFGRGGVSITESGSAANNLEVKYERFLRYHTKDRLDITIYNLKPEQAFFSLEIDKGYTDKIEIEKIQPEPEKTALTENGVIYYFTNRQANQAKVIFYLQPDKTGNVKTTLRLNDKNTVHISQFIYP